MTFVHPGTCVIDANQAGNANYTPAPPVQQTITVQRAPLVATVSGTQTYGGTAGYVLAQLSGLVNHDLPSVVSGTLGCTTSATASSPVGSYPITGCSGLGAADYTISYTGSVSVTKAPLTVAADNQSRSFGAANPGLTARISGFVNGQTLATSGVTGSPACTTTAQSWTPGGAYAITCGLGSLAASNYSFPTFIPSSLTVRYSSPCLTGQRWTKLVVKAGDAICLAPGFSISAPVTVAAGGALDVQGNGALITINGPLTTTSASAIRICGMRLNGPLSISGTTGLVVVGDSLSPVCAGDTITGPVSMQSNLGGVKFRNNVVFGPVSITGTTGTLPAPDSGSTAVSGNSVSGKTTVS